VRRLRHERVSASVALILALGAACTRANSDDSIPVDGRTRTYVLHVPAAYSANKAAPLVIALHGRLGDGHGMATLTHFDKVSDEHGFLVVYPDGLHRGWADGRGGTDSDKDGVNDVKFLSELIHQLESRYKVDAKRVYVTGISNGGFMTHRLACELGDEIAAAAPVAATLSENTANACHPAKPVSIAMIMGAKDPLVPIEGGALGRNGARGKILSFQATADKWSTLDGCTGKANKSEIADSANDGTTIHVKTIANCKAGSEVMTYEVEDGGHTWPGGTQYLPKLVIGKTTRNMDASEVLWSFFAKHSR
jgi:polyhydroxybutyrate depolymerase